MQTQTSPDARVALHRCEGRVRRQTRGSCLNIDARVASQLLKREGRVPAPQTRGSMKREGRVESARREGRVNKRERLKLGEVQLLEDGIVELADESR